MRSQTFLNGLPPSRTMFNVEDRELAQKVAAGDPEAIAKLIDRFYPLVFRFLWHASGSNEDAEDLACQALIRVRADIHRFRSDGPLAAWVYSLARREYLRFRRRQILSFSLPSRPSHPPSNSPNDDLIVIQQALATLHPRQRTAFLLTEVEGLTVDEASRALGVPTGTVKSRCHHAKKRLRKFLGPAYPEISNYAHSIQD